MSTPAYKKLLSVLPWLIIAVGVVLRLMIFFKNNCLYLDEVNVALNVYDRSFTQLFTPLDNNQYAPPGFLVILKVLSDIFGNSEYVFRFPALVFGIASLSVMYFALRKYVTINVLWYPLGIMAVGFLYVRYAAVVKPYSSDIFITLSLLLLALKYDVRAMPARKFVMVWMLAGGMAIWFSMPSVFVLASVGIYYLLILAGNRSYGKFAPLTLIVLFWLLNFGVYYFILLREQVSSVYLHYWHHRYFLNVFSTNKEEWDRNWWAVRELLFSMGGRWTLSIAFHLVMMFLGAAYLLRRDTMKGLLIVLPIVFTLIAVCMHKYTMIDRVMLFAIPLILILIASGMQALFELKSRIVNVVVTVCAVICVVNFSELKTLASKTENEEITQNLDFALKWNIQAKNLYIHKFALPAARYYIEIHSSKDRYSSLKNYRPLYYETNMDSIGANLQERTALLYSFEEWNIIEEQMWAVEKYANRVANNAVPVGWICIFEKK